MGLWPTLSGSQGFTMKEQIWYGLMAYDEWVTGIHRLVDTGKLLSSSCVQDKMKSL